jgi:hypothetical protein
VLVPTAGALDKVSTQGGSAAPDHVLDRANVTRQHGTTEPLQIRFTVPTKYIGKGDHCRS